MVSGKLSCFEVHVGIGKWVLDCLVLTNGSTEHDPFAGVVGRSMTRSAISLWKLELSLGDKDALLQCCVSQSECFAGEKAALCVHSVENLNLVSMIPFTSEYF
jgi:hypothetical protein